MMATLPCLPSGYPRRGNRVSGNHLAAQPDDVGLPGIRPPAGFGFPLVLYKATRPEKRNRISARICGADRDPRRRPGGQTPPPPPNDNTATSNPCVINSLISV